MVVEDPGDAHVILDEVLEVAVMVVCEVVGNLMRKSAAFYAE